MDKTIVNETRIIYHVSDQLDVECKWDEGKFKKTIITPKSGIYSVTFDQPPKSLINELQKVQDEIEKLKFT